MALTAAAGTELVRHFVVEGELAGFDPLPGGHINDSYRVVLRNDGREHRYLLQRLNPRVFPNPTAVMENVAGVTRHMADRLRSSRIADWQRRTLTLVPTQAGAMWHADGDGAAWRLYRAIPNTVTRERAGTPAEARATARAFGRFLTLMADYAGPLHDTIPGFHDTRARFRALDEAVRVDRLNRAGAASPEIELAFSCRGLADLLPPLLASGDVPMRVTHNDAKIANVLFDATSGEAICVIDLDTVMPGSALYDFGDLARSMASPTAEDEPDLSRVQAAPARFEAIAAGYLDQAGAVLAQRERSLLVFAARLITLEQAVRFLTDHLDGDRYFRVADPVQNLRRARAQLRLFTSLTEQEDLLVRIVERTDS